MVRATVSQKTRLPSMKDRYSYKFGTAMPNPELKPERSTTVETGYQGALGTPHDRPGQRVLQPDRRT